MSKDIRNIYFGSIALLLAIIATLNFYAYQFHWYWKFWWFDMIMHTLGGIWVGSFSLWYCFFRKDSAEETLLPLKIHIFYISLATAFIVGAGWELFEFSVDTFITLSRHDPIDTASDLFFDVVGGTLAVIIFFLVYTIWKKVKKQNQIHD